MLTPAEKVFVMHFDREAFTQTPGRTYQWLMEHDLTVTGAMTAFQYAHQESGEWDHLRELAGDIPPLEIPWATRQEFVDRVRALAEEFPWLKSQPYADPDFKVSTDSGTTT